MTLNLATAVKTGAQDHPQRTALILGDRRWTWAEFEHDVSCLATGLRGLGLEPGERIALMIPNVPEFTIAYFAAHWAGLVVVPLNVLLTADEVAYHLEDSEASALVAFDSFLEAARPGFDRSDHCTRLIVAGEAEESDAEAGDLVQAQLIACSEPMADTAPTCESDTAVLLYTSGTTGRAKGAELSHFNLFYNADYSRTTLLPLDEQGPVGLMSLPLFHSFGQTVLQNRHVMEGGTLVFMPRFDPAECFRLIAEHGVMVFAGVPTMYFALLHHPDAPADLSSLSFCVSGGAPMPVEVMREFEQRYGVVILEGYGLSETSPVASFNMLDRERKPGSIGLPIRGVEFQLRDDEGRVLTDGGPGEIWIKGHNVMKGYWRQPEATAEALRDGWFATGDVATVDEDGYYFIIDRKKDMLLRGGFNVYPREIEEVLYTHPAVVEAAVIGVPDPSLGEEVCAVVALTEGSEATEDELIAFCKQHLAAYKYPRQVLFRDSLPKGPTGKILKRTLRDELGG